MATRPHFLVAAGSSWEAIDQVRQWGNIFTGQTGLDAALALLDVGDVTLLTSNLRHAEQYDGFSGKLGMLGVETYRSHAELRDLLHERVTSGPVDAVLMSAAVSDYKPAGVYRVVRRQPAPESPDAQTGGDRPRPGQELWLVESVQAAKVKSTHGTIAVLGETTEKLVDLFRRAWDYRGILVKFKLEAGLSEAELTRVAEASRQASGADLIVANTLEMVHGPSAGAYLMGPGLCRRVARAELAAALCELVAAGLARRGVLRAPPER